MSGIYGVWQPAAGKKETEYEISKLQSWNKAYGTTAESLWADDTAYLGCALEKYREDAPVSAPVLQKNGVYAVIDALLYNREELLEEGGFAPELSDEELLLAYVQRFGYERLKQVNGDFAGAVYDVEKNQITLFRDHMGVRPLFYYATENSLAFSSDIRGLVAMEHTDVSVSEEWLWCKLTGSAYFGTENTEFAHICCVKPASYMSFTLSGEVLQTKKSTYWEIGAKKVRLSSENAYRERLRELITDSIQRRLHAVSGLVAGELSGGLDSGVIDILIHRLGREAVYFSWSASPEELPYAEGDERFVIQDICAQENISCKYAEKEFQIGEDSILCQKVKEAGWNPEQEEGFYRRYVLPPYINTLQIAKAAQYANERGAKVVFTGHGGDETVSHRCNPYELFYHREYWHYLMYMWEKTKGAKHRIYHTLRNCYHNALVVGKKWKAPFESRYAAKDLISEELRCKFSTYHGKTNPFAYDPLTYIRWGGSRNRLDVTALLGAYSGARYIAPYLDYRVADYAVSIPRNLYLKHGTNRYIFKETFKDIMPKSLYNVTGKEDTSWRNLERKEITPAEYLENKQQMAARLDRTYWKNYFTWNVLEQWAATPKDKADELYDAGMTQAVEACLSLQEVVGATRGEYNYRQ